MKALLIAICIIGSCKASSRSDNPCSSQSDGTTFPVSGKCTSYYYCSGQTAVELPCPGNLQYSASKGGCITRTSSECVQAVATTTTTERSTTTTTGLTGNECYDEKNGALIPYPGDCTRYLVCQYFDGTVMDCPGGLHFNPVSCVCDWPTAAGCTQGESQTTTTTSTSTSTTTPTSSTSVPTPTLGDDEGQCKNQEDGELFPYPWDCAWYIRCEDDSPILLQCEDGWLFNPILKICDYPENAGCTAVPYPTTTPLTTTTSSTATPLTLSTSTSTAKSSSTTPLSTSTSTSSSTVVVTPTGSEPTLGTDDEICVDQEDGTLFPYPWNCAWYIRCEQDAPLILPCEDGWLFNPILKICDYPENAGCIATPYPTTCTQLSSTTPLATTTSIPVTPTGTPPTVATDDEICVDQEDGALFPYPWNCAWYIRCEQDAPVILPCEDGWLFNPILKICDYPDNAGCIATPYPTPTSSPVSTTTPMPVSTTTSSTTRSTTTPAPLSTTTSSTTSTQSPPTPRPGDDVCINKPNGALFPYPYDCEFYMECEDDNPVVRRCEVGWFFNPILKICDYPYNTDCSAEAYPTTIETSGTPPVTPATGSTRLTPETVTPGGATSTPSLTPATATSTTPESTTKPSYVGTGICRNQDLGALLPYPGKCSLYIICEETAPIAIACEPEDYEFNAELKVCQEPEEAGCSIIKTTTTEEPTTTTPWIDTGICADLPVGDLLPYPGNCSQYIKCELPAPIALECTDGLEFNAALQLCESAEDAGCSNFTSTTTYQPETSTTPAPGPGMTGICRGREEGDLIPYPGDCGKYILCENPIPIAQKCGYDLNFNADLEICDEPDDAGCSIEVGTTTISSETTTQSPNDPGMIGVCKGRAEGEFIPYPNSCNKYIRCETPVPIAQTCKSGLHFNEALGICDTMESAGCPGYSSTTLNPGEGSTTPTTTTTQRPPSMSGICHDRELGDLISYPDNCSKFIICDSPVPIAKDCQKGLHFNADLQICDSPESAGCEPVTSTTTPVSTTPEPSTGNVCCGIPIGDLVPYPEDCSQYIRCEYPIPLALSCAGDLHFSTATETCEDKEVAKCQWYTTTTSTTTTTEAPRTCATEPDGTLLPFEGDCKQYYYCSDGEGVPLPCPIGTIFSESAKNCVPGFTCPN